MSRPEDQAKLNDRIWHPGHPHAQHKSWSVDARPWMRTLTFAWFQCWQCGRKVAAAVGWPGKPECDDCGAHVGLGIEEP